MRWFLVAFSFITFASAAQAAPDFISPGWYEVADTIYGPILWSGPYADKASCEVALDPPESDADYLCEYHASRPDWDE